MNSKPIKPANAAFAAALLMFAALCGAWYFQYQLGYAPCPLCYQQRIPYYFAIPLGLLLGALALYGANRSLVRYGLYLLALILIVSAGLGVYHAGVEWGFWPGPNDCSGPVVSLGSAGSLLQRLDTVKVIRCDEVQFRFLGISLAGYNVLISLLMAAIAGWGIGRTAARG